MKVGFSTSKGNWISKAIIFFTKDKDTIKPYISHSFPIIGRIEDLEFALSSDEIMTNVIDVNRYRTSKSVLRIYHLNDIEGFEGWQNTIVHKYNQKIYPHLELIWFIWRWVRRLFNPSWDGINPIQYSIFCSELTIEALRLAGYDFKGNANSTDAMQLEEWVKLHGVLIEEWGE